MDGLYEKGAYDYYPHASTRSKRHRQDSTPDRHSRHTSPVHSTAIAMRSRRSSLNNSPTRYIANSRFSYNPLFVKVMHFLF